MSKKTELKLMVQGKSKNIYALPDDPTRCIIEFRDDITAFNGIKKEQFANKGKTGLAFTALIMNHLKAHDVPVHFEKPYGETQAQVLNLTMYPIEFIARNYATGGFCKRFNLEEHKLKRPIFECFYKDDGLGDPFINRDHILYFEWMDAIALDYCQAQTARINEILSALFESVGLILADFKLEFGHQGGQIFLGDEFTPDNCRIWDAKTLEKLDKDRFRLGMDHVIDSYQSIFERVQKSPLLKG